MPNVLREHAALSSKGPKENKVKLCSSAVTETILFCRFLLVCGRTSVLLKIFYPIIPTNIKFSFFSLQSKFRSLDFVNSRSSFSLKLDQSFQRFQDFLFPSPNSALHTLKRMYFDFWFHFGYVNKMIIRCDFVLAFVYRELKIKYSPHLLTHLQCKPINRKTHFWACNCQSAWIRMNRQELLIITVSSNPFKTVVKETSYCLWYFLLLT